MSLGPFEQPAWEDVPERPPRSHGFFQLPVRHVTARVEGRPLRLCYREHGEGPPLLLVHGLMTSGYSFRYVIEPLAALGFRVLVPDLPGAGQSEAPPVCSPAALTASLGAFLDALALPRADVVGNSMGGWLAMRWALEAPDRLGRLVNVHSPAVALRRLRLLHRALAVPGSRAALGRLVARDPERWAFANVHYFDEGLKSREEARVYAAPLKTEAGRRAFASWLGDGLAPEAFEAFVATLRARRDAGEPFPVPLQLVYARRDPMVPPEVGEALHALVPGAEMVWLAESSHFAHVDTPEAFVAAVAPFLRGGA
ncbi:MAG TPA: alpha/beta hydrolase [Polyangiaceae bacterium LLY-WYZ-15_(1-7)]|nr:hypothetical protein [Myxococcales bacterium]MAT27173.1 hypothetical protein [Sandaracinus sp.]HJK95439.1 alpha/beta hydrolase [Polyangiaceae bacterium LLY-WYZ-15_(1-7)]MBJ75038.1 hypothetical protein [Sandaracinus sp.]HJL01072.1 alpha/beta hydrolase [Polyangiaceae bacterium LLY-WYZ-15_(1-7)]